MQMHFPSSNSDLEKAKKTLGFEEIFELTLAALINKYELFTKSSISIKFKEQLAKEFVSNFRLTYWTPNVK